MLPSRDTCQSRTITWTPSGPGTLHAPSPLSPPRCDPSNKPNSPKRLSCRPGLRGRHLLRDWSSRDRPGVVVTHPRGVGGHAACAAAVDASTGASAGGELWPVDCGRRVGPGRRWWTALRGLHCTHIDVCHAKGLLRGWRLGTGCCQWIAVRMSCCMHIVSEQVLKSSVVWPKVSFLLWPLIDF